CLRKPWPPELYGYGHLSENYACKVISALYTSCALHALPRSATNKTRKTRRDFPMKTLLRTTIIGLLVCAGYAAVATDINVPHNGATMPWPSGCGPSSGKPRGGSGLCHTK